MGIGSGGAITARRSAPATSPVALFVTPLGTLTLLVVLGIAVRSDMLAHRIPNALTGIAACAGLFIQSLHAGAPGLLGALGGIAVGALFMLPFYLLRGMGAGDVKLMGAIGSFLGPKAVLLAAAATLLIGAALGLARLATHFAPRLKLTQRPALPELEPVAASLASVRKEKFPYAIAIAGGSLISLFQTGHLTALLALMSPQQ